MNALACRGKGLHHRQRAAANAGMVLIEALAYVAILAIVVNVTMSVFVSASRLSLLGTTALDRLTMVEHIREGYARTVREAQGVVSVVGAYRTGGDRLVLEMPRSPEHADARRYVVFGFITSTSCLGRLEIIEKDGQYSAAAYSTYALPVSALRFGYDTPDPEQARLMSLEVDVLDARTKAYLRKGPSLPKLKTKAPVTYRFVANPRSV